MLVFNCNIRHIVACERKGKTNRLQSKCRNCETLTFNAVVECVLLVSCMWISIFIESTVFALVFHSYFWFSNALVFMYVCYVDSAFYCASFLCVIYMYVSMGSKYHYTL